MPIIWRRGTRMSRSSFEWDHSMEITAVPETVTSAKKEPPQIKSKCIKNPPIYQAGPPSLIPTVGGCELHAWINNEPGKKEYVINSAMEKSTQPRVKHMPRPWSRQGEQNVKVGAQSGWGSCVGQGHHWAGTHFRARPETETKAGRRRKRRDEPVSKAIADCLCVEEPGLKARWSASTQTRWKLLQWSV